MGDWEAAVARLERTPEAVRQSWVHGLAINGAAPLSVLDRILALDPLPEDGRWLTWRELSLRSALTVARHPDPKVRALLLENPAGPPEVFALLAHDPVLRVRRICVVMAAEYGVALPPEAVEALAADESAGIRYWATALPGLSPATHRSLAADPEPKVRAAALDRRLWALLTEEERAGFLADPEPPVREAALRLANPDGPLPTSADGYRAASEERRRQAAAEAAIDRGLAELLVADPDPWTRAAAARNPHLPTDLALALAEDPDEHVRMRVSLREDLTEEQRAGIDYLVRSGYYDAVPWVLARQHDPEAMRRIAASSHLVLRRSVATVAKLPEDVVAQLAEDEDYFVRLTLAECCDDAPHELLIELYTYWHGLRWSMLTRRPNFVRPGLARYTEHSNYRLRYAALLDPEAGAEQVEGLSRDRHSMVADRAAADPRLPRERLAELLADPGRALAAARNPGLEQELMHRLLDLAGVPAQVANEISHVKLNA